MKPSWIIGIIILVLILVLGGVTSWILSEGGAFPGETIPPDSPTSSDPDQAVDENIIFFIVHPAYIEYDETSGRYIFEGTHGGVPSGQAYIISYPERSYQITGHTRIFLDDLNKGDEVTISRANVDYLPDETKIIDIP